MAEVLQSAIGEEYRVTLTSFQNPKELLRSFLAFNLVLLFLNPALPDKINAHELVSKIKKKPGPAIILLTNGYKYEMDSAEGFKRAGADDFFHSCHLSRPRHSMQQSGRQKNRGDGSKSLR